MEQRLLNEQRSLQPLGNTEASCWGIPGLASGWDGQGCRDLAPGATLARVTKHQARGTALLEQPSPCTAVVTGFVSRVGIEFISFTLAEGI